jgi:ribonuclease HII
MKSLSLKYEKLIWEKGFKYVAGLDEAGRGSFAGPVVAGCVVFESNSKFSLPPSIKIDDSKRLTRLQRERSYIWIKENALAWGVGLGSVAEINSKGISKATASGFRRSVGKTQDRLGRRVDFLLVDAFYIPYVRGIHMPKKTVRKRLKNTTSTKCLKIDSQQLALVHGDQKSFTIAAASIIAKVYRDKLMVRLSKKRRCKKYHWEDNKGYGTTSHTRAIRKYGTTRHHRKAFVNTFLGRS